MSDIVERLRKGIEWTGPTQDDTGQTENLMDEAADEIISLRAEVEQAQMREACAAGLAREWEQHCKTAEAEVEKLKAALTLSDAIWPLAYRNIAELAGADFSDQTLDAWRAYDAARADLGDTP